jgi:2'-5' RNA ligase
MHAIWLTFSNRDHDYLKKIIDKISEKYYAPKFEPHVTVYGLINSKIDHIDLVLREISLNCGSCKVKKTKILQSEELWKTVFIELEMNKQMKTIHENLKKYFGNIAKYEFKPHISLIYKTLSQEEKNKIINELELKNEFIIDKLVIQKFFPDIEKWQIVKKYNLL